MSFPSIRPPETAVFPVIGYHIEVFDSGKSPNLSEDGFGDFHINDVGEGAWEEIDLGRRPSLSSYHATVTGYRATCSSPLTRTSFSI